MNQLQEVADRLALRALVEQYAKGADNRSPELFGGAFTKDGVLNTSRGEVIGERRDCRARTEARSLPGDDAHDRQSLRRLRRRRSRDGRDVLHGAPRVRRRWRRPRVRHGDPLSGRVRAHRRRLAHGGAHIQVAMGRRSTAARRRQVQEAGLTPPSAPCRTAPPSARRCSARSTRRPRACGRDGRGTRDSHRRWRSRRPRRIGGCRRSTPMSRPKEYDAIAGMAAAAWPSAASTSPIARNGHLVLPAEHDAMANHSGTPLLIGVTMVDLAGAFVTGLPTRATRRCGTLPRSMPAWRSPS